MLGSGKSRSFGRNQTGSRERKKGRRTGRSRGRSESGDRKQRGGGDVQDEMRLEEQQSSSLKTGWTTLKVAQKNSSFEPEEEENKNV